MKCPFCEEEAGPTAEHRSRMLVRPTLLEGHIHNPNAIVQEYSCSNGHVSHGPRIPIEPCPVEGCEWNDQFGSVRPENEPQ